VGLTESWKSTLINAGFDEIELKRATPDKNRQTLKLLALTPLSSSTEISCPLLPEIRERLRVMLLLSIGEDATARIARYSTYESPQDLGFRL
jgi:hypothetical protein